MAGKEKKSKKKTKKQKKTEVVFLQTDLSFEEMLEAAAKVGEVKIVKTKNSK